MWEVSKSKCPPLTLCILMNSSIWFETMILGWLIVHIKGWQVRIFKLRCTSVTEDCFYLRKQCRPWWNVTLWCISSGYLPFAKLPGLWISCIQRFTLYFIIISFDAFEISCIWKYYGIWSICSFGANAPLTIIFSKVFKNILKFFLKFFNVI